MELYMSRMQFGCKQTNHWIMDMWKDELFRPAAILVGMTYPVWAAVFYVQSFSLLEKSGMPTKQYIDP